jgi:tetratricopeptide (TPR) repeat protein
VIGPLLQLAGRAEDALEFYGWYEKAFTKDRTEPHMLLNWGLALSENGDRETAIEKWWQAAFLNPYIIPHLLGYEPKPLPIDHEPGLGELDYAEAYSAEYSELWDRAPQAWLELGRFWEDAHVKSRTAEWTDLALQLARHPDPKTVRALRRRQEEITVEPGDGGLARRLGEGWGRGPLVDTLLDKILTLRMRILSMLRRLDRDNIDPAEMPRPVIEGQAHADAILQSLSTGLLNENPGSQDLDETAYVINMLDPMIRHFQQVLYRSVPGATRRFE